MKLGKLAPKHNDKTLLMARYMPENLPEPPTKVYYEYKVKSWPMFLNDSLGDCVVASAAHMLQNWTGHTGKEIAITDKQVQEAYSAVGGYVIGDVSTDNGLAMTDFMDFWKETGFAGKKIDGWVKIDHQDLTHVKQAIRAFGVLNIGVQLPGSAMDQTENRQAWSLVEEDGGIEGGHCIPIFGYGRGGTTAVTWGALQQMTWEWWERYVDEAYAVVSLDWLGLGGTSPSDLNAEQLKADLQALRA